MSSPLIQRLVRERCQAPASVRELLQIPRASKPSRRRPTRRGTQPNYIKGVNNGNYFRIKVPPKRNKLPNIPKLPPTNPMPKAFKPSPPKIIKPATAESPPVYEGYPRRILKWLRRNTPIIILNFGSICTLIGFTRSDVLELRSFAITGNIAFVFYTLGQNPILWPSIAWSALFASVNGVKIFEILQERNAEVHMTRDEEEVFVEHFMPHGITPKQYERILSKAEKFSLKEGDLLIQKGEKLDHLYLVVEGSTHAHIFGRKLTAASTNPNTKGSKKEGGDSGAWVGEMAFLDRYWEAEQGKVQRKADEKDSSGSQRNPDENKRSAKAVGNALYTIVVSEDCHVLSWSHESMEELMQSSTDLRAALTRAMTSALVGKVINLTVSRTKSGIPRWAGWLKDWKNNDGASVQLRGLQGMPEENKSVAIKSTAPGAA